MRKWIVFMVVAVVLGMSVGTSSKPLAYEPGPGPMGVGVSTSSASI